MKLPSVVPHSIRRLLARKRIVVISGALIVVTLASATAYAYHRQQTRATLSATPPISSAPAVQSSHSTPSETATTTEQPSQPTAATSVPQATAPSSASAPKQDRPKPTPISGPTTPPSPSPTATFSASAISPAYTYCTARVLYFMLGGVDIYASTPTTQSFSWKLEVSDGTVSDTGTDQIPSDTTHWFNFPSTYAYPSSLGSIENANDGDRVRFVITSPNYYAGPWSNAVPAGSEAACAAQS